jgi:hypothetical protein
VLNFSMIVELERKRKEAIATTFLVPSHHFPACTEKNQGARGGVVVKELRYKPAGRGFDSRWCHWNFSVT